jgi:hypothetical protein
MSPLYSAMCRKNAVREAEGILFNDTGLILAMSYRFYVVEKDCRLVEGKEDRTSPRIRQPSPKYESTKLLRA